MAVPDPEPAPAGFRRLLVGTDISSNARIALSWAIEIARRHSGRLVLVHSVEPLPGLSGAAGLKEEMADHLARLEAEVREIGIPVESRHEVGRPWQVIARLEREIDADLIVIGSRGHTPYSRLFLGSTADRVIRVARGPVLVVHPGDERVEPVVRKVLVATDFSEEAALATSAAVRLLRGFPGDHELILLHACHTPLYYDSEAAVAVIAQQSADQVAQAQQQLETLAAPLRAEGLEVRTIAREGYPPVVIDEEARVEGADLIAVGTHGRSGLRHLLIGSIAERVIHHASCPVLTMRHAAPDEAMQLSEESRAVVP